MEELELEAARIGGASETAHIAGPCLIVRGVRHGTSIQLPVASISHQLGFDEATNFVKYFKRES